MAAPLSRPSCVGAKLPWSGPSSVETTGRIVQGGRTFSEYISITSSKVFHGMNEWKIFLDEVVRVLNFNFKIWKKSVGILS